LVVASATLARSAMSETRLLWNPFSAMTEMAASRMRSYLSPARPALIRPGAIRPRSSEACVDFDLPACLLCAIVSELCTVLGFLSEKQENCGLTIWGDSGYSDSPNFRSYLMRNPILGLLVTSLLLSMASTAYAADQA